MELVAAGSVLVAAGRVQGRVPEPAQGLALEPVADHPDPPIGCVIVHAPPERRPSHLAIHRGHSARCFENLLIHPPLD